MLVNVLHVRYRNTYQLTLLNENAAMCTFLSKNSYILPQPTSSDIIAGNIHDVMVHSIVSTLIYFFLLL